MKKSLVLAVTMLLVCVSLNAQNYLNIGYGRPTDIIKFGSLETDYATSNSLFAGFSHNFGQESIVGLEPGIEVVYMFDNKKDDVFGAETKIANSFVGLRAPILLNVGLTLANSLTLKAFVGPTLSYGLSCTTASFVNGDKMYTIDYYDDQSYNRFNVAATAALAAEINNFRLKVSYDYGLTNISNTDSEKIDFKENILNVSLGFKF